MTTIVIDFKNKKIVADRQLTCTSLKYNMFTETYKEIEGQVSYEQGNKIHQVGDGVYLVGAGDGCEIERQKKYYETNGCVDINSKSDCTIAVVRRKGDGLFVDTYEYKKNKWKSGGKLTHEVVQGSTDVITFGSGGKYAFGAFKAGCSAEDSVRVASKCDQYTSYEIDMVSL